MSERETSQKILDALKLAATKPAQDALTDLNSLIPLVQGGGSQELETEEARASAFLAICELGKALHRGQPAERLHAAAITAAERWAAVVIKPGSPL
jgi:hypothetical protein